VLLQYGGRARGATLRQVFVLKERPTASSDVKPPASDDKEIVEEKKAASDQKAAGEENTVAPSDEKLVPEETPKPPQEEAAPSNAEIESVIANQSETATIEESKQAISTSEEKVASETVANSESMEIGSEKPMTTARPENGAVSETQPSTSEAVVDDTKPSTTPGVDVKPVESQEDAKALDAKPLATSESPAVAKEDASGPVLVLNSGRFKTVETKYIINEAAKPLSVRIISAEAQQWTVCGDGLAGRSRDFEDKMEIPLKSEVARASAVKKHMDDKISEAKDRERRGGRRGDYDSHRDFAQPPSHGWRPGMPPPGQWPPGPPAPAWHGSMPGAWGAPPHVPPGHHWDPHRPPFYGVHPGAPAGPPARPRGPLPDSMFQ